jgi:GNAT superfamily N-acetyltransferase
VWIHGSRAKIGIVITILEIDENRLPEWVATMKAADDWTGTVEDYVDWRRQARHGTWFLASEDGRNVGAAFGIGGWHEPPGVARGEVRVIADARGRGTGSALLERLGAWAAGLGYGELLGEVRETDAESIAWTERRGYVEVGRNSKLVLDLAGVEAPGIEPPEGIEIVTWAERPDLAAGMYAVAREAYPDIPGGEDEVMASFDDWLSADMQGSGDRPEATWIAVAGEDVVGYAKLSISNARPGVVMHDITGVLRTWRGRGIASALKRAEIAWAVETGATKLETSNEERNTPIRRLNERHGYKLEPGQVTVRGPISAAP